MNSDRFKKMLDVIESKKEANQWDQRIYGGVSDYAKDCGSPRCFIGWAAALAVQDGVDPTRRDPWDIAINWLEITVDQEGWLCQPHRSLKDFRAFYEDQSGDVTLATPREYAR